MTPAAVAAVLEDAAGLLRRARDDFDSFDPRRPQTELVSEVALAGTAVLVTLNRLVEVESFARASARARRTPDAVERDPVVRLFRDFLAESSVPEARLPTRPDVGTTTHPLVVLPTVPVRALCGIYLDTLAALVGALRSHQPT